MAASPTSCHTRLTVLQTWPMETAGLTLVVRSHGRWPYLARCLGAVDALDLELERRILSVDGDAPTEGVTVGGQSGWEIRATGTRQGLVANLRQAWDGLSGWVLDVEEDFIVHDLPVAAMKDVLRENPHVAVMNLKRHAVNAVEGTNILHGPHYRGEYVQHERWVEHRRLWSLNPSLFHSTRLIGITPGVEYDLTKQALAKGMSFGMWGQADDPPRCTHIGEEMGMGTPGWSV
jgi:hypothetical protein